MTSESSSSPRAGLVERIVPHFLHELGNLHLTVRGNLDLEREEAPGDSFLHPASEGLERAERLVEALRVVLRPFPPGEAWDPGEAVDAVLLLLAAATRDGALTFHREPSNPLPPLESDRRAFCQALLLLGLDAADAARASPEGPGEERRVAVSVEPREPAGGIAVRLRGFAACPPIEEAAPPLQTLAGAELHTGPDEVVLRVPG